MLLFSNNVSIPDIMLAGTSTFQDVVSDDLGSVVRFVVNVNTGIIAQQLNYDEFGNVTQDSSQVAKRKIRSMPIILIAKSQASPGRTVW